MEFTEAQLAEGAHVLSEWVNDRAPIGESLYVRALKEALKKMLDTPPDAEVRRLY